jgi:hypothetical protein
MDMMAPAPMTAAPEAKGKAADRADMETAVLGHGELDGPYTELAGLAVERDQRFPVRVTVQFYQATGNGRIGRPEIAKLASLIDAVYTKGDFVGSLVVPAPQVLARPTRWQRRADGPACPPGRPDVCEYPGLAERWGVCCPAPLPPAGIW